MNRAEQFAMRTSIVGGGSALPVFVLTKEVVDADTSRGERGSSVANEFSLEPRPLVDDIKGDLITRSGIVLKAGDFVITVPANQLDPIVLKSEYTQFRLGSAPNGQLLRIVAYERDDYDNSAMRYRIFVRGVTNR